MENEQGKRRPLCFWVRSTQWNYYQACTIIGSIGNQYGGQKLTVHHRGDAVNQVVW